MTVMTDDLSDIVDALHPLDVRRVAAAGFTRSQVDRAVLIDAVTAKGRFLLVANDALYLDHEGRYCFTSPFGVRVAHACAWTIGASSLTPIAFMQAFED